MPASSRSLAGPPAGHVHVATVGRAHGLDGAVRLHPTDVLGGEVLAEAYEADASLWIEGVGEARLEHLDEQGHPWRARFDRIRRRELAERIVHARVYAPAPEDADNELIHAEQLVGWPLYDDGMLIGTVVAVEGATLSPLLRIRLHARTVECFVPLAAPYVVIDEEAIRLVDPPEGLLDDA